MTNTTDLHLQYRMETGKWFQWDNSKYNINAFHGDSGYTDEYTKWLEEKLLEKCNNAETLKTLNDLLEYAETEVRRTNEEIERLEEQVEYYSARDGGGQ